MQGPLHRAEFAENWKEKNFGGIAFLITDSVFSC